MIAIETEDLLRRLTPQVLGAVVRRYGHFDLAEDAVQEALLAASRQWPGQGRPDNPKGWLITAASRRLTDLLRADQARRRREDILLRWPLASTQPVPGEDRAADADDTLVLLLMCSRPSLSVASQIALTLRAVGGLTVAEIARAFLVSEATMTRRITRAKQTIKESGVPFALPGPDELSSRLDAVLRVLYLIFTEGYASTLGATLQRVELAEEALRLARTLHRARPDHGEASGLLALMLLVHARRRARSGLDGALIPMAEQDRARWDRAAIDEGTALITATLPHGPVGPYQLQAAIAAVHDEATSAASTDWPPDRGALRGPAAVGRQSRRPPQPRGRRQHGRRPARRTAAPAGTGGRRPARRRSPVPRRAGAPPRVEPGPAGRPRRLREGRRARNQPATAALPARADRPPPGPDLMGGNAMPTTDHDQAASVDAYIATAPEATRPILRRLRSIIRSVVPDAEETISYGMPSYRYHGRFAYFAAHQRHVGLYALGPASDYPDGLRELTVGRGTIRFAVGRPIPEDLVRTLVADRAAARRREASTGGGSRPH